MDIRGGRSIGEALCFDLDRAFASRLAAGGFAPLQLASGGIRFFEHLRSLAGLEMTGRELDARLRSSSKSLKCDARRSGPRTDEAFGSSF